MNESDLQTNSVSTNTTKKDEIMRNFVDVQAIMILLHLTGNPKTRTEIRSELKEIPHMSLYRKMAKLEKFGLIRQIVPVHKKKTKNNVVYESTSRNFVISNRNKTITMTL